MTGPSQHSYWSVLALTGVLTLTLGLALASPATAGSEGKFYQQHNLVSDIPDFADHTDPNLVNAWGLALGDSTFFWVADNGTGVSTLYNGAGELAPVGSPLVVTIPGGKPTGVVFNGTSDFVVGDICPPGSNPCPSLFIFATETGVIAGWNPFVPAFLSNTAIVKVPSSDAIYKGLALASIGPNNFLYAANFHAGTIDVFDKDFAPVLLSPGAFVDPKLPDGYAPFNIQELGGQLYVAYAKQDEDKADEVAGKGNGFVDIFNPNGDFVERVDSRGKLNAPWGLAFAPDNFGRFSGDLLVGNFGDGLINAYTREGDHFHFHGQLKAPDGQPVQIDGLWALRFGKGGANNGPENVLFFTAGPEDESHGLFGSLTACKRSECGNP
jgi:uncharacterized protein (TIGR03118 family)